jgi:hypothetical protein
MFFLFEEGDDFVHKKTKERNLNKTTTCMYKCIIWHTIYLRDMYMNCQLSMYARIVIFVRNGV